MSTSSNKHRRGVSATNLFHMQHFHTHTTLPQFFHTTLPHTTLYINFVTHAHRHTTLSHLFGTYWKKVIFGVFRSFNFRVHWEHVLRKKNGNWFFYYSFWSSTCVSCGKGSPSPNHIVWVGLTEPKPNRNFASVFDDPRTVCTIRGGFVRHWSALCCRQRVQCI